MFLISLVQKNTRSVKSQSVEENLKTNDWLFEILGNITRLQKNAAYKQTVRSQCLASDAVPIQKDFPVSIENSLNKIKIKLILKYIYLKMKLGGSFYDVDLLVESN